MPHYIGMIHKDRDSCYGLSFPDLPGVFTAGDSIDETMRRQSEFWSSQPRIGRIPTAPDHSLYRVLSMNCARTRNFRKTPPTL